MVILGTPADSTAPKAEEEYSMSNEQMMPNVAASRAVPAGEEEYARALQENYDEGHAACLRDEVISQAMLEEGKDNLADERGAEAEYDQLPLNSTNNTAVAAGGSASETETETMSDEQRAQLTQLGQCEQCLSEMEDGALQAALHDIQDILVRNHSLIAAMESSCSSSSSSSSSSNNNSNNNSISNRETRALRTLELRGNMIELARLTAEVPLLAEAPKFRGPLLH